MQAQATTFVRLNGTEHDLMAMARAFPQGTSFEKLAVGDQRLSFDNSCVKGSAVSLGMHFGMRMHVSDFQGRAPIRFGVEHAPTELEFAFCRGQGSRAVSEDGMPFDFGGGEYRIGRIRETTRFHYTSDPGAIDQTVQINLSTETLSELLGTGPLPRVIESVVDCESSFSLESGKMDHRMHTITDEILESCANPQVGSLSQHLYLEGKAMELVAVLVDDLVDVASHPLSRGDLERVHRARETLRLQLSNPPSASQLAREAGMGERRFKQAFKQAFGAPVMSYARKLRLDHARKLLSERAFNVTEVAHRVGYANPSKFAAAYRRQFGMVPSAR